MYTHTHNPPSLCVSTHVDELHKGILHTWRNSCWTYAMVHVWYASLHSLISYIINLSCDEKGLCFRHRRARSFVCAILVLIGSKWLCCLLQCYSSRHECVCTLFLHFLFCASVQTLEQNTICTSLTARIYTEVYLCTFGKKIHVHIYRRVHMYVHNHRHSTSH